MMQQLLNVALGLWLMAAPAVLGYGDPAASGDHIVGPIIASFAAIALTAATRVFGRVNAVLGLWLIIAPWIFGYPPDATLNGTAVGVAVIALSLRTRPAPEQFGGGWVGLWRDEWPPRVRR